jgi:pyruvate-ferredoxin/flavodoxin oxidoreductase
MLLNKEVYQSLASSDGACLGCSEKTVVHLFMATVESLMQPRIEKHVKHLDELIAKLEEHIQLRLMKTVDISDSDTMEKIVSEMKDSDLTMADITSKLESEQGSEPVDQDWLRMVTQLLSKLKNLKWKYTDGTTGRGRSTMGMLNATGCTSVWGSTYPFNPYPFPWANHLFQDSPSLAMGVFEGHMSKMAEGFKAVRMAEMELGGKYNEQEHKEFFTYFNWHQFTDEEWHLCPPVVAVGGDGAMYDIGFQNLSRMMASGKPIKAFIVDTQVYSNTGGQACTSGFIGQISDMAQYGKAIQGKDEPRKEIGLIAMAHRNTYVLQSTMSNTSQMIEGFIDGLMQKRPAVFNIYTSCQPEHGIGDDMGYHQAKLAVESRAYPIYKYNPQEGTTAQECFDLQGNPAMDKLWPSYKLKYLENGQEKSMELAMTFADFAITEARFRKHFRKAPRDTWNENMVQLSEFLEMDADDREGKFPFIWTVDAKQQLTRVMVAEKIVESCEERRDFWIMLRDMAGIELEKAEEVDIEKKVRAEIVGNIAQGLMKMAGGDGSGIADLAIGETSEKPASQAPSTNGQPDGEYMAPWLETEECTSCDECVDLNAKIFAYNNDKKAFILDPNGGPYQDIVKAAEKCTAGVIHPGLPADRSIKDVDKWIKRGEKFN